MTLKRVVEQIFLILAKQKSSRKYKRENWKIKKLTQN